MANVDVLGPADGHFNAKRNEAQGSCASKRPAASASVWMSRKGVSAMSMVPHTVHTMTMFITFTCVASGGHIMMSRHATTSECDMGAVEAMLGRQSKS